MSIIKQPQSWTTSENPVIFQFGSTFSGVLFFDINVKDYDTSSLIINDKSYVTPINPTSSFYNIADITKDLVRWEIVNSNIISEPIELTTREVQLEVAQIALVNNVLNVVGATQTSDPFTIFRGKLNRVEFTNFDYNQWVLSGTQSGRFLTDKPNYYKVNDANREYLYFLKENSYQPYWVISALSATGSVTGVVEQQITDNVRAIRLDVSPKVIKLQYPSLLTGDCNYKVEIKDGVGTASGVVIAGPQYYSYEAGTPCNIELVNVLWENNLGGIDSYQFVNPIETRDVTRTYLRKNSYQFNETGDYLDIADDIFNQQERIINSVLETKWKMWTKPLTDDENNWLAGLLNSRNVWIEVESGRIYPVSLVETSYTINQNKYQNELVQSEWTFKIMDDLLKTENLIAGTQATTTTSTTTTTTTQPVCPIITGLTYSAGTSSITADWDDSSSPVDSYQVSLIEAQTPGVTVSGYPQGVTASNFTFTGLNSGTDYYIYVSSVCSFGNSSWTEGFIQTSGTPPPTTTSTTTTTTTTSGGDDISVSICYFQDTTGVADVQITLSSASDVNILISYELFDDFGSNTHSAVVNTPATFITDSRILTNSYALAQYVSIISITPLSTSAYTYSTVGTGYACF